MIAFYGSDKGSHTDNLLSQCPGILPLYHLEISPHKQKVVHVTVLLIYDNKAATWTAFHLCHSMSIIITTGGISP